MRSRTLSLMLVLLFGSVLSFAGVSRAIQEQYKKAYENKAMFLKIPIYAEKQMVYVSGQNFRVEQGSGTPRYKVGDQMRVLLVDFGGDEIKLRLGGIATAGFVELGFKFDSGLLESFPNRDTFDRALQSTLTEGLKYTDIDDAKDNFVRDQFDRAVKEMASSASVSRETVLKNIAPFVPAYVDAQRDLDNLRNRVQDLSSQVSQSQSENRKLEAESRAQQAELTRLKNTNASLQDKLESYTSQISKLGDEVRDAKGSAQGYQKELANLQRSLNIRVDANRDLTSQISDLGQAMKKLQKDNDSLGNQLSTLRTTLDAQQAANARLVADNDELKASTRSLKSTLATLTSSKDSLGRQYLDMKTAKEKLDDFTQAGKALRTRIVEEAASGSVRSGKANVYINETLVGWLDWNIPAYLNRNESQTADATFSMASIDYVRLNPDERHVLKTLGEKVKVRLELGSPADSIAVTPAENKPVQDVAEREHSTWKWAIQNQGTKDARLILTAKLINKDAREIALFQQESLVTASNMVRQVRGYLQPIPLIAGAILGFLLFGIVGVFRRGSRRTKFAEPRDSSPNYVEKKRL